MDAVWTFLEKPFMKELITVLFALLALFIAFRVVNRLLRRLPKSKLGTKIDPSAMSFLQSLASFAIKALLIIIAAGIVGVPTSSLVALIGSAGLAVGLAMQGSLSNFAGGVMILLFRPFQLGDLIQEPGGELGRVADISIFYTTILVRDNRAIVLPNGTLANGRVVNFSAEASLRISLDYTAAYGTDAEKVRRILEDAAHDEAMVLDDPAPIAVLSSMGESALIFTLLVYCKAENYFALPGALNLRVLHAFNEAGVSIPFPQMDVHMVQP